MNAPVPEEITPEQELSDATARVKPQYYDISDGRGLLIVFRPPALSLDLADEPLVTQYFDLAARFVKDARLLVVTFLRDTFSSPERGSPKLDFDFMESEIKYVVDEPLTNSLFYGCLGMSSADYHATGQTRDKAALARIAPLLRSSDLREQDAYLAIEVDSTQLRVRIRDSGVCFQEDQTRRFHHLVADSTPHFDSHGNGLYWLKSFFTNQGGSFAEGRTPEGEIECVFTVPLAEKLKEWAA